MMEPAVASFSESKLVFLVHNELQLKRTPLKLLSKVLAKANAKKILQLGLHEVV